MASRPIDASSPVYLHELDRGACSWPTDAAVVVADTASLEAFSKHRHEDKLAVYVWKRCLPTRQGDAKTLVGVAAASIFRGSRATSCISFRVHALAINEDARSVGLGQQLYGRLHESAFEVGQQEYASLLRDTHVIQHKTMQDPKMDLSILPGDCRRRHDALRLYVRNHWLVTCDGGMNTVTEALLVGWQADGTSLEHKGVDLHLPPIRLTGGYFSSLFNRESVPVGDFPSSSNESALSQARCASNFVGEMLAKKLLVIAPSCSKLSLKTGLLPFFVPASPCRVLDAFLQDSGNWSEEGAGESSLLVPAGKVLLVGGASLSGFYRYDNINSSAHIPHLQAASTLKTQGWKDIEALLKSAPGFAVLVDSVLSLLGYPQPSSEQVSSMLKAVHFFRVDASRQTSFAWHTDDTDLGIKAQAEKLSIRTAVIQLGAEARTAMQILGFQPFAYEGRGAGSLFHGAAVHRSVDLAPPPQGIWKVTLFVLLPLTDTPMPL